MMMIFGFSELLIAETESNQSKVPVLNSNEIDTLENKNPKSALAYFQLGLANMNSGEYSEAVEAFNNSVRINPGFALAHFRLGIAYLKLNNIERAEASLTKAVSLNPDNASARFQLGEIFLTSGKFLESEIQYKAVIGGQPKMH